MQKYEQIWGENMQTKSNFLLEKITSVEIYSEPNLTPPN